MKLELKNIKHTEWASQETNCYQASLYVDGKAVAVVSNDGHGGPDMEYPHSKFKGDYRAKMSEVYAYFKTLPNIPSPLFEDGYSQDLDGWCFGQVISWLSARELKGKMRNSILFQKEGDAGIFGTKYYPTETDGGWSNGRRILNDMPFADALVIWSESAA
jgi:hypothetical protein